DLAGLPLRLGRELPLGPSTPRRPLAPYRWPDTSATGWQRPHALARTGRPSTPPRPPLRQRAQEGRVTRPAPPPMYPAPVRPMPGATSNGGSVHAEEETDEASFALVADWCGARDVLGATRGVGCRGR